MFIPRIFITLFIAWLMIGAGFSHDKLDKVQYDPPEHIHYGASSKNDDKAKVS